MTTQYSGSITLIDTSSLPIPERNYFWFLSTDSETAAHEQLGAGVYITDANVDDFKNYKQKGYIYINNSGLNLGIGDKVYTTLTTGGLTVEKGGILGGNAGQNGFVYLSTEPYVGQTTITIAGNNSNWKQIIGTQFGVTTDGSLYASSGRIAGWNITANDFYKKTDGDNNGSKYFCINAANIGTDNNTLAAATCSNNQWNFNFRVTGNGKLYATDANIDGTITAKNGEIGGWTIDSNSLSRGIFGIDGGMMLCSTGTESKLTIGHSGNINGWVFTASNKFGVTNTGKLYATGVDISGIINATAGSFDSVSATNFTMNSGVISNSVTIGNNGTSLATIDQNTKIYQIGGNGTAGYHFLGTLKLNGQTDEADIEIHTGDGQNNGAYQNLTIRVNIKMGWQGDSSGVTDATAAGITVRYENDPTIVTSQSDFQIKVTCTNGYAQGRFNVYLYSTKLYIDGWYQVRGRGYTWTHSGAYGSDATPTGVEQTNIRTMNGYSVATNYITQINPAGIFISPANQSPTESAAGNSVKIDGTGMKIYNGGVLKADYGTNVSIYKDSNNYINLSNNGLKIYKGGNLKASYGDAVQIYGGSGTNGVNPSVYIGTYNVQLIRDSENYTKIDSNGMQITKGNIEIANFGAAGNIRLGASNAAHSVITSSGLDIYTGSASVKTKVASFGSTTIVGSQASGQYNITINNNGVSFNRANTPMGYIKAYSISNSSEMVITGNDSLWLNGKKQITLYSSGSYLSLFPDSPPRFIGALNDRMGMLMVGSHESSTYEEGTFVSIGVGTNGKNRGLFDNGYDFIDEGWIIYHNGTSASNGNVYIPRAGSNLSTGTVYVVETNTSGRLTRRSSSRRYKKDISNLKDSALDPKKLYDLRVVQFKYRNQPDKEDKRYDCLIPGFIAEEVAEVYPIAACFSKDGVEDWTDRHIIPPMLALIQDQHKEIELLKQEINQLKQLV